MKIDYSLSEIKITLDAQWEKDTVDWIVATYGINNIKKFLNQYLTSKEQAKAMQVVNDKLAESRRERYR